MAMPKILLVEDNPLTQKVTKLVLEGLRCRVDIASSGEEAIAMFDEGYHLLLMDLGLPKMDGIETTQKIRNNTHGKTVPIIAMTAHALESDRQQCLDAEMNDIIIKPISLDSLKDVLSQYVNL